jgi:hypothetical protein
MHSAVRFPHELPAPSTVFRCNSWLVKPGVGHSCASRFCIAPGEENSAIAQQCGSGEQKSIERCTSHWNKCSGIWIVELRSIGPTRNQHPAIFKRDHSFGQLKAILI